MTLQIALVIFILLAALVLFVTEWVRMDVVALLVLGALAVTGLVTPTEALSGFSNAAVVTVWAMFILSEGLARTGVANIVGRQVLRLAGQGERRMILVIVMTGAVLSAFMNNIGVAALMLPVVMDIARVTGYAPSRLLMPLAYGSLLGGLTTLIGTPPNLLIAQSLEAQGLSSFGVFDYAPVGLFVLFGGALFIALVSQYLLPQRNPGREASHRREQDLQGQYQLKERAMVMQLKPDSVLIGKTLAASRLSSALGLIVTGIIERDTVVPLPGADTVLKRGQRLLVQGRPDRLQELRKWKEFVIEREVPRLYELVSGQVAMAEVRLNTGSSMMGQPVDHAEFRRRFGVNLNAVRRQRLVWRINLASLKFESGDALLVQGAPDKLDALKRSKHFDESAQVSAQDLARVYRLHERMFAVRVPTGSGLVGRTLASSRLGDAFDFRLLGIIREGRLQVMPEPSELVEAEDRLLIQGRLRDIQVLGGLQELIIEDAHSPDLQMLESEKVALLEAMLSPRSGLAGKALSQLQFRERYGIEVLAIWREGRAYRSELAARELQLGDGLLLMGPRDRLRALQEDPDFLILTQVPRAEPDRRRAPLAGAIMLGVVLAVLLGWLPIAISAVLGATAMVVTRCLDMEDAYRAIDWRAIFLIAGMLPLGVAMSDSGAAAFLANGLLAALGPLGPWPVIAGLYLVTSLATMIIPTAALVVLMSPIVLTSCQVLGIAPQTAMMAVAMAASASFTSPVSHPANVLVMGPGGYRFNDYLRLGVPLTIVVFIIVMLMLPVFWPLQTLPLSP